MNDLINEVVKRLREYQDDGWIVTAFDDRRERDDDGNPTAINLRTRMNHESYLREKYNVDTKEADTIYVVFDGEGPELQFVEVEDEDGESVSIGEWVERDGYSCLKLTVDDD